MNRDTFPSTMRPLLAYLLSLGLFASVLAAGCAHKPTADQTTRTMAAQYTPPNGGEKPTAFSSAAESDAFLQKLLTSTPHKSEARAWLKQIERDDKRRVIGSEGGDMRGPEALDFVNGLYSAGAVSVTAVDMEIAPQVEGTSTLIVELPNEASARKKVLAIEANTAKELDCAPTPDRGQKLVMFHW